MERGEEKPQPPATTIMMIPDGEHSSVSALCEHGCMQVPWQRSLGQCQLLHLGRYLGIALLNDGLHHQTSALHDGHRWMLSTQDTPMHPTGDYLHAHLAMPHPHDPTQHRLRHFVAVIFDLSINRPGELDI